MRPAKLKLPPGCEVYNFLYPTRDPEYLVQDLLTVALPNGYHVDVTWAPEHDPQGEYIIRVFKWRWDNQQITPICTRDFDEVVRTVARLAAKPWR